MVSEREIFHQEVFYGDREGDVIDARVKTQGFLFEQILIDQQLNRVVFVVDQPKGIRAAFEAMKILA